MNYKEIELAGRVSVCHRRGALCLVEVERAETQHAAAQTDKMRSLVCALFLFCALAGVATASEIEAEAEWPATLLEHTAIASGQWATETRSLKDRMAQATAPKPAQSLGAGNQQLLFAATDSIGTSSDAAGTQSLQVGRAKEPLSDSFGVNADEAARVLHASTLGGREGLAPPKKVEKEAEKDSKFTDKDEPCDPADPLCHGPYIPPPPAVPPPEGEAPPEEPADWPNPPPFELPPATPPKPSCGELCDPQSNDPWLARIPGPPLTDALLAEQGAEGEVLRAIMAKIRNREGWLRAQKQWLQKAVEASNQVRHEIELATHTRDAVLSDLQQLQKVQDTLSIRYKANKLKWAYKDKKMSLENVREELSEMARIKKDIEAQLAQDRTDVAILENTLKGQYFTITPEDIEQPLKFLEDLQKEGKL